MSAARVLSRAATSAAARVTASPAGLAVAGVFYLLVTAALASLWSAAADANGGMIAGYSTTALVWYVATSETAIISLPIRLIEDVGDDIGSGRVVVELLRPTELLRFRVAVQFGAMGPRLLVCVASGVVFASLFGGPPPDAAGLALAAPALVLAVTTNLVAQHTFAGAAFWVRDAKATWFLYQKLVFVLGGMLIPLEVMPGWLETAAKLLPFMAMAYVPARLASGHVEPLLLVVQLFWLLVLGYAATRVFRAGERRILGAGA